MRTRPPMVAAAKQYGFDSFRKLMKSGLYTVTVPPKHTVNEIRKLLEESAKSQAYEKPNI